MSQLLTLLKRNVPYGHKIIYNGSITSEITFVRSSTAMCFVDGVLTSFVPNVPRFGTLEYGDTYTGFIFEDTRTNYVQYSTDSLGGSWGRSLTTLPVVGTVATPIPGISAPLYVPDTSNILHNLSPNSYGGISSTIDYVSGTSYTFSCFVYSSNTSVISKMRFESPSTAVFNSTQWGGGMYVDLATGAVVGNTTGTTTIVLPNGWTYIKMVRVATGTSTQKSFPILYPNIYGNNPGDGTSGFAVTGCQAEVGSFASSYISTNGTIATRAADTCILSSINSKPWFNPNEGTLFIDFKRNSDVDVMNYIAGLDNGTFSERIDISQYSAANSRIIRADIITGGSQVMANSLSTGNSNIRAMVALAYKANDNASILNNGSIIANSASSVAAINRLVIGGGFDGSRIFGAIKTLTYYPRRLSNTILSTLQA